MSKTVFMIHGMWGGGWYWQNYRDFLTKHGYRCIAPTLRYHNINPNDPPPEKLATTSVLDYAADLEKEIVALDEKPILMGHSMGGLLAQILASRGLAEAAVLVAPASPRGIMAIGPSVVRSFWSMMTSGRFWRKAYRQTFNEAAYSMLQLMSIDEQKKVYRHFVYESGRATGEIGFWPFDRNKATAVDAAGVTCPVLVLSGAEDRITPPAVHRRVAKKYKADYKLFPDHAHWLVSEPGWEDIAGYALSWLNEK